MAVGDRGRLAGERLLVGADALAIGEVVEHVAVAVGVGVREGRTQPREVRLEHRVERPVVLGQQEHRLEIHPHRAQQRHAVGERLVDRLLVRPDDARRFVAHQRPEPQPPAAAGELDGVGVERRLRVHGDRALGEPPPVELGGVAVGIAAGLGDRAREMREVVRRDGLQAVAQRVVDLIVGRRRQTAGIGIGGGGVTDALEGVDPHG